MQVRRRRWHDARGNRREQVSGAAAAGTGTSRRAALRSRSPSHSPSVSGYRRDRLGPPVAAMHSCWIVGGRGEGQPGCPIRGASVTTPRDDGGRVSATVGRVPSAGARAPTTRLRLAFRARASARWLQRSSRLGRTTRGGAPPTPNTPPPTGFKRVCHPTVAARSRTKPLT